jgi:hypothetical protein
MRHSRLDREIAASPVDIVDSSIPVASPHTSASDQGGGTAVRAVVAAARYAPAAARDQFLGALDASDLALSARLARHLTGCMNPLPGTTCGELGLPRGSTYGCAARHVLRLVPE